MSTYSMDPTQGRTTGAWVSQKNRHFAQVSFPGFDEVDSSDVEVTLPDGKSADQAIVVLFRQEEFLTSALQMSTSEKSHLASRLAASMSKVFRADRGDTEHRHGIAQFETAVSPQTARALQVTENAYRRIGDEFGYLTSSEVAARMNAKTVNRTLANQLRIDGKLLAIQRTNRYLFPGFQFDDRGQVKPVMERLIRIAEDAGWDHDDLLLWLGNPTSRFDDDRRPLDHLDEEDLVVDALQQAANDTW